MTDVKSQESYDSEKTKSKRPFSCYLMYKIAF